MSERAQDPRPERLGRYLVGAEIGAGGMAVVHLGAASGDLGFSRMVAIKRIHAQLAADPSFREAIQDEARIAARIRHPNVVGVVDVLTTNDDVALVLEYVHGESLAALLKAARIAGMLIPVEVAVSIAVDVLHGLAASHVATDEQGHWLGVVHRDVSPQNVLVGLDGSARVLDFGVAKAQNRCTNTRDGVVKGKVGYMAPEQLGGEATVLSDLYAVGLLLWEMLVGRSPFASSETQIELLALALQGVTRPPSAHRPDVPAALDEIVMTALAAAPSARYASASAMAEALERAALAAPRSTITALVTTIAGRTLEARARAVADLERSASRGMSGEAPPTVESESTAAVMTLTHASLPARGRARPWRAVVLLAAVGAVAAAFVFGRGPAASRWRGAAVAAGPSPTVSSPPRPLPSPSVSVLPEAPPVQSGPGPSAERPTPAGAPVSTLRRGGGSRSVRSAPSAASAPDCATPYSLDENGFRTYRRECL